MTADNHGRGRLVGQHGCGWTDELERCAGRGGRVTGVRDARLLGVGCTRSAGIGRDDSRRPVRIGIVGELYVVMEPFASLQIEERLGRMGVEVKRPLCLSEMLHHVVLPHQRRGITRRGRPFIHYELR